MDWTERAPSSAHIIYIKAPPEKVWEALTSSEISPLYFFGRTLSSDWRVGSRWTAFLPDGGVDTEGEVLAAEPPRRLVVSWRVIWIEELRALPQTVVAYDIEPAGEATKLTVSEFVEASVPDKYKEGGKQGWPMILSSLKTYLETGQPLSITPQA